MPFRKKKPAARRWTELIGPDGKPVPYDEYEGDDDDSGWRRKRRFQDDESERRGPEKRKKFR